MSGFLNTLFDPGQVTCFAPDAKGTQVRERPYVDDVFFSINALDANYDNCPSEPYHHVERPRRADGNVICFRNFLIELDGMPLEHQLTYVKALVPVTSIVYSGGKSYHFIISLEQPLASMDDYRHCAERLHALVKQADPACKNPSRLSRLPNVLRLDTGKVQALVELGNRVPNQALMARLPQVTQTSTEPMAKMDRNLWLNVNLFKHIDAPETAITEMGLGGRNGFFYWLGKRLAEAGADSSSREALVKRAYSNMQNVQNFSLREALHAARVSK